MRLMVVEDEEGVRELLIRGLGEDGHQVVGFGSAEEATVAFQLGRWDGFLLDWVLPGTSGVDLCRWLRDQGTKAPIYLLSAKASLNSRIEGLDAGADDYLTKPVEVAEIRARLRAFQRRALGFPRAEMQVADLNVNPNTKVATRGGQVLELSRKEFALLDYLIRNRDRTVSRAMIAHAVWDSETALYTNVIDVIVTYLRRKVDGEHPLRLIHTVRGKGFVLSDREPAKPPKRP